MPTLRLINTRTAATAFSIFLLAAFSSGPSGKVRTLAAGEPATSEARSALRVGETVDFSMYTHCGVESTRINGRVWNAVDPLHSSPERLGPRAGWANPEQDGRLTL